MGPGSNTSTSVLSEEGYLLLQKQYLELRTQFDVLRSYVGFTFGILVLSPKIIGNVISENPLKATVAYTEYISTVSEDFNKACSDKKEVSEFIRINFLQILTQYIRLRQILGEDFASKVDSYFETQIDDLDLILAKINGNTDTNKNQKVKESTNSIPEIVFEGVEMEVSNNEIVWEKRFVFCKVNGFYLGNDDNSKIGDWKYARPVENKKIDVSITDSTSETVVEEDAQESFMRKAMSRVVEHFASSLVAPTHLYGTQMYSVSSYVNAGMCYLAAATEEFAKDVKETPRAWPFRPEYFKPRESDIDNLIEGVAFILHAVEKMSFLENEAKKSDSSSGEEKPISETVQRILDAEFSFKSSPAKKQQTAMQDLKEDLQESIITAKKDLEKIDNIAVKDASKKLVEIILNAVIKRIDEELLLMEKEQHKQTFNVGFDVGCDDNTSPSYLNFEQYYNETYGDN